MNDSYEKQKDAPETPLFSPNAIGDSFGEDSDE